MDPGDRAACSTMTLMSPGGQGSPVELGGHNPHPNRDLSMDRAPIESLGMGGGTLQRATVGGARSQAVGVRLQRQWVWKMGLLPPCVWVWKAEYQAKEVYS